MDTAPIGSVVVVDRHRENLGNLKALADSIRESGLLHPIVITSDRRLVAGHRRLEACRLLGMDEVPVRIVSNLTTARSLLFAERDENTCRLDMTPGEKVVLGLALEELERPAADERKREGNRRGGRGGSQVDVTLPSTCDEQAGGSVRALVASSVGMAEATYGRAKTVVNVAEGRTNDTPEVRTVAVKALAEMNETGVVKPAFEKLQNARNASSVAPLDKSRAMVALRVSTVRDLASGGNTSAQIARLTGLGVSGVKNIAAREGIVIPADAITRGPAISGERILDETVALLEGIASGLALIEDVSSFDAAKRKAWSEALRQPLAAINRLQKELRG